MYQLLTSKFTLLFHHFCASFLVSADILLSSIVVVRIAERLNPADIKVRLHILHTFIRILLHLARPSRHIVPAATSNPFEELNKSTRYTHLIRFSGQQSVFIKKTRRGILHRETLTKSSIILSVEHN
jgi:hypothetical protein